MTVNFSQTITRYLVFVFLPLASFLAQFWRTAGVITQVYFFQNETLGKCADLCILPPVDNPTNNTFPSCCRPAGNYDDFAGLNSSDFNENDCAMQGIDFTDIASLGSFIYYIKPNIVAQVNKNIERTHRATNQKCF